MIYFVKKRLIFSVVSGGVEEDTITFESCRKLVDEWITASEVEIASALLSADKELRGAVEGAAGMAMACFIKERHKYRGRHVVVICCGGNVGADALDQAAQLSNQSPHRASNDCNT